MPFIVRAFRLDTEREVYYGKALTIKGLETMLYRAFTEYEADYGTVRKYKDEPEQSAEER